MAVRISVTSKNKKLSGLKVLQDRLTEGTANALLDVARVALEAATESTPKWSGRATEGWRISLVPRSGYTDTINFPIESPVYKMGIEDTAAAQLNQSVVDREVNYLKGVLKNALANGKVSFYLVNDVAYSAQWLNSDNAGTFLRAVNQDYYTIRDIEAVVKQYKLGTRLGGWV